ncbi:LOW QUALITY PROTEIN: hypothetical protein MAR_010238 [Mya arenaria]|uniref:Tetraspanin n=1 Tax=Mya arenaria TaxID=6604 RepID=A0ABY7E108_MYAAR|nr:LOW QUALITY PROTEIN: hypothetical protein MAR_010238 [Mya arenaria]
MLLKLGGKLVCQWVPVQSQDAGALKPLENGPTMSTGSKCQLIGVAILGLSIYLRVDYWINQYVLADDALQAYTTSVYVFIGVGVLIFIFTIVGIFAAARPDKMALIVSVWANDYQSEKPGERKDMAPLTCCADYKRYEDISYSEYKVVAFVDFIQENITYPAIIAFVIVGLQILCIVFTALTLYHLKKSPEPREDDVVYEMARTQEKSPYPARGGPYANLYQS